MGLDFFWGGGGFCFVFLKSESAESGVICFYCVITLFFHLSLSHFCLSKWNKCWIIGDAVIRGAGTDCRLIAFLWWVTASEPFCFIFLLNVRMKSWHFGMMQMYLPFDGVLHSSSPCIINVIYPSWDILACIRSDIFLVFEHFSRWSQPKPGNAEVGNFVFLETLITFPWH